MATMKTAAMAQTLPDRLAAAQQAEEAAKTHLTALRERHKAGDQPITAREFADAGAAVELAELERQGAEAALAEFERQERSKRLAAIRQEIERLAAVTSDEVEQIAADAVAAALAHHQERTAGTRELAGQLQGEHVPQTVKGQVSDEDGGLGWRRTEFGGYKVHVYAGQHVVSDGDDPQLVAERIMAAAARKAGLSAGLFCIAR